MDEKKNDVVAKRLFIYNKKIRNYKLVIYESQTITIK